MNHFQRTGDTITEQVTIPGRQPVTVDQEALLRRAAEGDAEAFCHLAAPCERRLFQRALALCRNPALAEDLAAETLVAAWKSIKRFDGRCRFSTWLYAILVHRFEPSARP